MLKLMLTRILRRWPTFVIVFTPLLFLPLIFCLDTPEAKCAYVLLVVIVYWMTAVVPLAVTALLPVALFPLLGVLTSDKVATNYLKNSNVMMMTGIMMAIAIEHCNLHRRIALRILLSVGSSPKWLMLGFMITTAFLSMWLSNTATAAMMTPIVESIVLELKDAHEETSPEPITIHIQSPVDTDVVKISETEPKTKSQSDVINSSKFRTCVLLSVAYAANLGGIGTMNGSGSNMVLIENISILFPEVKLGLSYATWMFFSVPCLLVMLFLAWLWLIIYFLGPRAFCQSANKESSSRVKTLIGSHYESLGPLSFHEKIVIFFFSLLVFLWISRNPQFVPGWQSLLPTQGVRDSAAGVLIIFLLFVVPSRADAFWGNLSDESLDYPPPRALTWQLVESRLPWGIILLMGGGYALADGFQASGLSHMLATQMMVLRDFPSWAILTISCLCVAMVTEVVSNAATANVVLPVMAELSRAIKVHPLYLMFTTTLCCSMAFMLPVATPVNAIVFRAANVSTWTMIKPGLVMNIIGVAIVLIFVNTLGVQIFNLNDYPISQSQ